VRPGTLAARLLAALCMSAPVAATGCGGTTDTDPPAIGAGVGLLFQVDLPFPEAAPSS
jgi:hypothetical protein